MSIKQMLLSTLILGAMSTIALTAEQTNQSALPNELPSLRLMYTLNQTELGYEQDINMDVQLTPMDQATLEMFKKAQKENDFTVCPYSINGQSKKVRIYNHNCPFTDKFNSCEFLKNLIKQSPPEQIELLAQYLASAQ